MFALSLFNVFNVSNVLVALTMLSIAFILKKLHPRGKYVISERLKYSFELLAVLLLFGNLVKIRSFEEAQWVEILANIFSIISLTVAVFILYLFIFKYKIEKKQEIQSLERAETKPVEESDNNFQVLGEHLMKIQQRLNAILDRIDNKLN